MVLVLRCGKWSIFVQVWSMAVIHSPVNCCSRRQSSSNDLLDGREALSPSPDFLCCQMWSKAVQYYQMSQSNAKLIDCLYNLEDYDGLVDLVTRE